MNLNVKLGLLDPVGEEITTPKLSKKKLGIELINNAMPDFFHQRRDKSKTTKEARPNLQ